MNNLHSFFNLNNLTLTWCIEEEAIEFIGKDFSRKSSGKNLFRNIGVIDPSITLKDE